MNRTGPVRRVAGEMNPGVAEAEAPDCNGTVRRPGFTLSALVFACSLATLVIGYPERALGDTTPPTFGVTTYGSVIGKDIHLYFSEAVDQDPENLPPPDAFYITVDGVSFLVRPGSVRGGAASNELVLGDLASPIVRGQTVRVGYVDPHWSDDDTAAIQDLAGNDTKTFDFTTIHNGEENTTDRRPIMEFVLLQGVAGNALTLHWGLFPTSHGAGGYDVQYARTSERPVPESAWLDGPQNLTGSGTGQAFGGERTETIRDLDYAAYYFVRVRGTNAHGDGEWSEPTGALTNPARPPRPTLVTSFLEVPASGTDLEIPFYRALDRTVGRIPSKDLFVASNPGVGPAPESARVDSDGDTVIVSFDEGLDVDSIPGSSAFAVTVGGIGVTLSDVDSGNRVNDLHLEIDGTILRDQARRVRRRRPGRGARAAHRAAVLSWITAHGKRAAKTISSAASSRGRGQEPVRYRIQ